MTFGIKQMTRALSFAHLTGGVASASRAQDDDRKDDEDSKKGKRAEDDDKDDDKDEQHAKAVRAEDDDDPDSDDDDGGNSNKGKQSKKAKSRASDDSEDEEAKDDDDDEEMHGKSAMARARLRERARCAAIFACEAAAYQPTLAANLAFCTRMKRHEAIAVLKGNPPPVSTASQDRAARNPRVGPGNVTSMDSNQAIAAAWDRAFARATNRPLTR